MAHSLWLSTSPEKRWTEVFFLAYSPFWILWALCIVVPFGLYEPRSKTPFLQRYWVKANLWIAIFSYIGNYFWTHYFYSLLGAKYTFPSWQLNAVPVPLYFMTHAYFCFYHALANICIRRTLRATAGRSPMLQRAAAAAVVFALSYATAYGETATIAHFPYYSFEDRRRMYTVGSLFYALYFFVSFPLFFAMDEPPARCWTAWEAARDALAAGMLVTALLDLWRLTLGGIVPSRRAGGLPWL